MDARKRARRKLPRLLRAEAAKVAGSGDPLLAAELLRQTIDALGPPDGLSNSQRWRRMAAAKAALVGLAPQGTIEGLMGVQMLATHTAAMACLTHAMRAGVDAATAQATLRRAERLLFVYARQSETLLRTRKAQRPVEARPGWSVDGLAFEPPPWMSLLTDEAQAWAREQLAAAARKGLPAPEPGRPEAEER
jgi:hypothetical protein